MHHSWRETSVCGTAVGALLIPYGRWLWVVQVEERKVLRALRASCLRPLVVPSCSLRFNCVACGMLSFEPPSTFAFSECFTFHDRTRTCSQIHCSLVGITTSMLARDSASNPGFSSNIYITYKHTQFCTLIQNRTLTRKRWCHPSPEMFALTLQRNPIPCCTTAIDSNSLLQELDSPNLLCPGRLNNHTGAILVS